ncbi:hypothetical protein ACFSE1_14210 [Rhizobium helianthi]|uniref:Uncharacterized protein n=1 Tax=Rhizobium helianthi TaxID=1132695 RepID=A0ABW4M7U4_9HYPH
MTVIIAHRGASARLRENSKPAWQAALRCIPENMPLVLDVKEENQQTLLILLDFLAFRQRDNIILGLRSLHCFAFCRQHTDLAILGLLNGEEEEDAQFFALGGTTLRLWESRTSMDRIARLADQGHPMWMTVGGWGTGRELGDFAAEHLRAMQAAGVGGFLVNDPALARAALGGQI